MPARAPAAAFALVLLLAGCLGPDTSSEAPDEREPAGGGAATMTAEETRTDGEVRPCTADGGVTLPPKRVWCAERTVVVTGLLTLPALPVELAAANGAVSVQSVAGDRWRMEAKVRGAGATEAEARAALDLFAWTHEEGGRHALRAYVEDGGATREADVSYDVRLPEDVTLALRLATTNGAVSARARVADVDIATTNGAVSGDLTPAESGDWSVATTNGALSLVLPEGPTLGYDISATTTNGHVTFAMRDGDASTSGFAASTQGTFRTEDFDERAVRVEARLATTNGAIAVSGR